MIRPAGGAALGFLAAPSEDYAPGCGQPCNLLFLERTRMPAKKTTRKAASTTAKPSGRKSAAKPVVKRAAATARSKSPAAGKPRGAAAAVKRAAARAPGRSAGTRSAAKKIAAPLDLSAFPPESISQFERWICLACVADVFTRYMGMPARKAQLEIKRHMPTLAELHADPSGRPFFPPGTPAQICPYCGSGPKAHARLDVYRIESGKPTDTLRRALIKSLPSSENQFAVLEGKATGQHAFYEWLDHVSEKLNFDDPGWLREVSLHYLGRKEPKVDWAEILRNAQSIRRSRRLESGWEVDAGRLFLAPVLFDELLLVQYLVSRSHKAGGLTLEGRHTLVELFARLRHGGYLRAVGIQAHNPSDALEQLLEHLSGGEAAVKFHYIVDRRDLLEKTKALKIKQPPKAKTMQR